MVRSKEAPKKKPKDPFLTPPSKPRGGFLDEAGRPWNRGGAAMSPAPASVPSYMRGTSSSDAKAGGRGRPVASVYASASPARRMTAASVSASPARWRPAASGSASASPARRRPAVRLLTKGKVLFPDEAPGSGSGLGRATCSSTMKDAKFPEALDLAPGATDAEGPAALRVCPYTYCSLNGHVHAPAVPLRSFLASRRRLIKTQQSMKLKGVSAFRNKSGERTSGGSGGGGAKIAPLIDEEAVGDFFVEVYAGPRVSSDMSCSDISLDEMDATVRKMEFVVFDRCGADEDSEKGKDLAVCDGGEPEPHLRLQEKHGAFRDSLSECSGADTGSDFVEELPWMRYHGYEYDDSLDDEISEEQRMREEEADGAEISAEQEQEQDTSGRSADDFKEDAAEEQEKDDVENTCNLVCGTEIVTDQGVACRVETCQEPDGRDEDNTLDTLCCGEASTGQGTAEEQLSENVYKSEIPDQEVAGWADTILEESCKEETSADQEANDDECSVESDGESEVTQEQDVEDEEIMPDDGSEMEISEDLISGDGCIEDFSEEVTSRAAPEGKVYYFNAFSFCMLTARDYQLMTMCLNPDDSTADYAFEQYVGTVNDAFEQDGSPANGHEDTQKEFCITRSKLEVTYEETARAQQTYQDGSMDGMVPKELEITTCKLEEAFEESANSQESNPGGISTSTDDAQVELDITTCKLKDASEESNATEECRLNNNAENVTDGAEMGPEITKCNLEDASEESGIDQDTAEDDDSACYSGDAQNDSQITKCISEDTSKESATTQEADLSDSSGNASSVAQEAIGDDDSAYISDDAQDDLEISKYNLEDVSKESVIAQEADQSHSSANVSSDAQNESKLNISELEVVAISDDHENESKTCKSEDVFEESVIGQEADHDESSAYVVDDTQNEYEVTTCHPEGAQVESDVIQENEDGINTAGGQKKSQIAACESGGAFLQPAMPQEAYGDINNIYASDGSEKVTTMPKLDSCEDVRVTEEADQSLQIPAEFTDAKEPSIDDICGAFSGMNLKGDVYFDPVESATCPRNKLIISRRRRTPEEEEYLRGFNPRPANFLPLELDPDAEKVDLKHQMMDERKNAEEWMIDYALRRAVTNLAPARKKKVELLVQAFETVLPHDEDDKKSISPTRPVQACN
ncbi:hypothetical protein BAE44_0001131 [Dichanthelium oligosanthes]|uniref:Calmodulin-binding domain-containing protein n=1 Tax=Dichanthelium oligosanthes TaxID=888268 RepID=A0A1E5WL49_9POAL|nr:hypothetical protein BAE44_0001131 [Dichanthelium oligosanthes]